MSWRDRKALRDAAAAAALALRRQRPSDATDYIWPMPTVAEVVAAGYQASYWDVVKADRDRFIKQFDSDPEFRENAIRQWHDDEAERKRHDKARAEVERRLKRGENVG